MRQLAAFVTLSLAFAAVWWLLPKPEPLYQSRRLSDWLKSLDNPPGSARFRAPGWSNGWSDGNGKAVKEALRHMGPEVVPSLRKMVNYRDHPLKLRLIAWVRKRKLISFQIDDEWVRHYWAAAACRLADPPIRTQLLADWIRLLLDTNVQSPQYDEACFCFTMAAMGNLSPSACRPLAEALTNANTQLRRYAVGALVQFRTSQTEEVASALLDRLRNDPDIGVQFNTLQVLRQMPATIVPALLKELQGGSVSARHGCLSVLENFTNEAPAILPGVLRELNDPDVGVRSAATNALRAIAPAAAAKAGQK